MRLIAKNRHWWMDSGLGDRLSLVPIHLSVDPYGRAMVGLHVDVTREKLIDWEVPL